MNLIRELRDMGQRLWLDNIARERLDHGVIVEKTGVGKPGDPLMKAGSS
ncbi:MAG: hypothetical protein M3O62_11735 [Pseudomonadota bacterium]|nr:hypothetical protein [Pseudomonadota bacterium]